MRGKRSAVVRMQQRPFTPCRIGSTLAPGAADAHAIGRGGKSVFDPPASRCRVPLKEETAAAG